jgi:hypothetical protein
MRRAVEVCGDHGERGRGLTIAASTDPEFITKMHRILDLYDHPPVDGRVICLDEFGR